MKYIRTLFLDQYFGLVENIMPHTIGHCPSILKEQFSDPRSTTPNEQMTGLYIEEFIAAMISDITLLEFYYTWTTMECKLFPGEFNILPGNWELIIKRLLGGSV